MFLKNEKKVTVIYQKYLKKSKALYSRCLCVIPGESKIKSDKKRYQNNIILKIPLHVRCLSKTVYFSTKLYTCICEIIYQNYHTISINISVFIFVYLSLCLSKDKTLPLEQCFISIYYKPEEGCSRVLVQIMYMSMTALETPCVMD